jgi:putative NADPH-quinone reductase
VELRDGPGHREGRVETGRADGLGAVKDGVTFGRETKMAGRLTMVANTWGHQQERAHEEE